MPRPQTIPNNCVLACIQQTADQYVSGMLLCWNDKSRRDLKQRPLGLDTKKKYPLKGAKFCGKNITTEMPNPLVMTTAHARSQHCKPPSDSKANVSACCVSSLVGFDLHCGAEVWLRNSSVSAMHGSSPHFLAMALWGLPCPGPAASVTLLQPPPLQPQAAPCQTGTTAPRPLPRHPPNPCHRCPRHLLAQVAAAPVGCPRSAAPRGS